MAKSEKNSTIFLDDWRVLVESLQDDDQLYFWHLFMRYNTDSDIQCDRITVIPVWTFIRSQLQKMGEKYNDKCETNRLNGSKGGRPRKHKPNKTEQKQKNRTVKTESEKTLNENEKDNGNENGNENVNKNTYSAFAEVRPTFDEFWDKYDHKVDRRKAEQKWRKVAQKDREKIMQHLDLYVPATNKDGTYPTRRNPTTYLNNETWNNEVPKADKGKKSNKKRIAEDFERFVVERHGTH